MVSQNWFIIGISAATVKQCSAFFTIYYSVDLLFFGKLVSGRSSSVTQSATELAGAGGGAAARIRELSASGMTRTAIAKQLGVSTGAVSKYKKPPA
jgi:hypothetical protein